MSYIKYAAETGRYEYPIPFKYGDESEIEVSLVDNLGRERGLTRGRDYLVMSGKVLTQAADGEIVHIWRTAPKARTLSPLVVSYEPTAANPFEGPSIFEPTFAKARQASEETRAETATVAAMSASAAVATETVSESAARIERDAGDAKAAAETATLAANDARATASDLETRMNQAIAEIRDYCDGAVRRARREAENARQFSAQVSQYRRMPGVASVASVRDIPAASPGLFVVNPHLTHSPTPFMGVWPAASLRAMQWDGVFFIGKPYEGKITLPPIRSPDCRPSRPDATGDGDDWLPCDHLHLPRCDCGKK